MKSILSLLFILLLTSCSSGSYYKYPEYAYACADEFEGSVEVSETCFPFDEQNTYMTIHKLWPSQKRLTKPMPSLNDY